MQLDLSPADALDSLKDLVDPAHREHDPAALQIRALALASRLKSLNRASNAAIRSHKNATAAARQEMDHSYLGLQNLQYEKRHLEREIEKCRQFASIYQDLQLHSIDDFKTLAPPDARAPEVLADEHELMLNRLSFELAERQRLDLKKKELLLNKEELLKQSKIKSTTMENIKLQIETLVKTAAEIQKKVDELVPPIPSDPTGTSEG